MDDHSAFLGLHRHYAELKIFLRTLSGKKSTGSLGWKLQERSKGKRPQWDQRSVPLKKYWTTRGSLCFLYSFLSDDLLSAVRAQ